MHFWEELEDCKFNDNEFLVDHLVEVVKDEGINSLEELNNYENKYFTESNMTREEWVGWYQKSLEVIPEVDGVENDPTADKIRELRNQIFSTSDINLKIKNIIIVCALLEREFCFLVEAYNLIMDGKITSDNQVVRKNIVLCGSMKVKDEIIRVANILTNRGFKIADVFLCLLERVASHNGELISVAEEVKHIFFFVKVIFPALALSK